uniref:Retrovirus-related Pol polyprotein from transposon TNT 1-94 n=1 Tax=Tanacetum cinerariifolium TaxID=118510 RepID=A0A699GGT6_TANCI|nr:hypothetical protein [Tanacetum cinerariifolium]
MHEFWATTIVHHHSIRFKMDNKKHIVNLESFKEMLHICPRLPGQPFVEPPFEEEILAFLRSIGHSRAIRRLTDVNINKLHQPWRSFAAIINKCLTRKSSGYDSLRLNIKIQRRAMRRIILGSQRDDHMFTTIKVVSKYQNTQQSDAMFLIELTNADIRNSDAYKEYYAVATGATPPKTKAGPRLSTSEKGKQPAKATKSKSLTALSEMKELVLYQGFPILSTHNEEETRDEESFDPIPKTPKNTDDEGNGEENLGMNVGREEGQDEEEEEDELYRDININLRRGVQMADVHTTQEFEDSHMDVHTPTLVAPLLVSAPTLTPSTITTVTTTQQTLEANFSEFMQTNQFAEAVSSILEIVQRYMDQQMNEAVKVAVQIQSARLRDESQAENDEFLKTIDENMQKIIKEQVKEQVKMNEAVKVAVQIQSARLRDESQAENDEFLKTIDENMQKIIKEQVKEQVKVHVFKILPKIEQTVNEQLEAEVLTRSSNSSKTFYVIAADPSEIELKKILIEKMKGNKSIPRSNEQRNLYKALVEAYESDKIILDTYGDTVTLKRRQDNDVDKDKEPSAGSD